MVSSVYPEAVRRVLLHEGGYSNHPSDPGGPTNFGITLNDYKRFIDQSGTAINVQRMKVDQAKVIYKSKYWDATKGDQLPPGVDYTVFDYGVNSGTGRAGKVLRRCCGIPADSSVINSAVIEAVNKRDPLALTIAINEERLRFLHNLKTWPVFGVGWNRRVAEVRAYSVALASGKKPFPPKPLPAPGKGEIPKPPVGKVGGGVATGTAAISGGLWEWIYLHPITAGALIAAVLAATVTLIVHLKKRRDRLQEEPLPVMVVPENTVLVQDN